MIGLLPKIKKTTQTVAASDTTVGDMHKYSLWLKCFISWWGKYPRSLREYLWKSLLIPFLIIYSAGEFLCVLIAIVSVTFLSILFFYALGVAIQ